MDPFVGEWKIRTWQPDDRIVQEGIPDNGFLVNGILTITQPDPSVNSFSLRWPSQNEETSFVSDLQRLPQGPDSPPRLQGTDLSVNFSGRKVPCDLTLTLESELIGSISFAESFGGAPDTGSGTFTATANGGGAGGDRKR